MMKQLTYLSILIFLGCNTLKEETAPLEGDFYIQDGWLAFSTKKYEEADKHFNTAIETNDEFSVYHFLSSIGKGWSYMYNAKTKSDSVIVAENMVVLSGNYFDIALSIFPELDNNLIETNDVMNLYAGLTLQRAYSAKQIAANEILWETENSELGSEIDALYKQSIAYSYKVDSEYVFKYDNDLVYEDIILLRMENYILIGEIKSAIINYKDYGFECSQTVTESTIIECLCEVVNDGECPFEEE